MIWLDERRRALMALHSKLPYTITNDVLNGDLGADTNWEYTYASRTTQDGKNCIQISAGSANPAYAHQLKNNVIGHQYYMRCLFKSSASFSAIDVKFEQYQPYGGPRAAYVSLVVQNTAFTLYSDIQTAETAASRIRCFSLVGSTVCYITDMIVVDLTAAFGAGNEPDKTWCDSNISYFSGSMIVYK